MKVIGLCKIDKKRNFEYSNFRIFINKQLHKMLLIVSVMRKMK